MSIIPSFFASDRFFAALNAMRSAYPDVFLKFSKHSSANILCAVVGAFFSSMILKQFGVF